MLAGWVVEAASKWAVGCVHSHFQQARGVNLGLIAHTFDVAKTGVAAKKSSL